MPDFSLLSLYNWRDLVEIVLFSTGVYYWLWWLNKDRHYHLIFYFYGYCIAGILFYALALPTLWAVFIGTLPVVLMLFITMHQQTLQKLLLMGTAKPATHYSYDWLHEIIAAAMSAHHKKQSMICVIERSYPLHSFIDVSFLLNADTTKELLSLLLATNVKNNCIFWLDNTGKLRASDIELAYEFSDDVCQDEQVAAPDWQKKLLLLTQKTDALVVANCLMQREFMVLYEGARYEKLTAHECFMLLKKFLYARSSYKEKVFYDTPAQTDSARDISVEN